MSNPFTKQAYKPKFPWLAEGMVINIQYPLYVGFNHGDMNFTGKIKVLRDNWIEVMDAKGVYLCVSRDYKQPHMSITRKRRKR